VKSLTLLRLRRSLLQALGAQAGRVESLLEVVDDVVDVLETQGDTDQVGGDTSLDLLLVGELLVGGSPGVDDEGLGVTDVGQVTAELEVVDDGADLVDVAGNTEGQDTTESVLEVLGRVLVVGVGLQTGVQNPFDERVSLEPLGEGEGVLVVALTTNGQGLETHEEEPGVERRHAWSQVTHGVHAELGSEGLVSVGVPELHAVVSISSLSEAGELATLRPVEVATVDDDTTHGGTVTTNPLGEGVGDDVGTELDGALDVTTHTEGVVDDQGDASIVGNLGNGGDIWDVVLGVTDGLDVDGTGLVINRSRDILGFLALNPLDIDLELLQVDTELVVGSTVQPTGADEVVAGLHN
jgi:hypothetical protein